MNIGVNGFSGKPSSKDPSVSLVDERPSSMVQVDILPFVIAFLVTESGQE